MILNDPSKRVPVEPEEEKEPAGLTLEQFRDMASDLKPVVNVSIPPRLNEWVFDVQRDPKGNILKINAKGFHK